MTWASIYRRGEKLVATVHMNANKKKTFLFILFHAMHDVLYAINYYQCTENLPTEHEFHNLDS